MVKDKLIIFTGPSGVGKATIEHELFKDKTLNLAFSVSATTRPPRDGEVNGVNYHFISDKEFNDKIANDEFLEWNEHFSCKYGTLKSEIKRINNQEKIPFIEVEVNGAANIIKSCGESKVLSIFIVPPSIKILKQRIQKRKQENKKQIKERLARVDQEMCNIHLFDFIVVNDKLDEAVQKVKEIIKDEKSWNTQ